MRRSVLSLGVIVMLLSAALTVASAQQDAPTPLNALAQQRVRAAEEVVKGLDLRGQAGEALTPTFVELVRQWENRLVEARLAAAVNDDQRTAAIQFQIARAKHRIEFIQNVKDLNAGLWLQMAQYDLADAEFRLAELRTGK
jgi:hypothetical protein